MLGLIAKQDTSPNYVGIVKTTLDSSPEVNFTTDFVEATSNVLVSGNTRLVSIDQERFLRLFLNEAGVVTDNLSNNVSNPYKDMHDITKQFDDVLGSYVGEYTYE